MRSMADLPRWATPGVRESRASWLLATKSKLPISTRAWTRWLDADPNEPERPRRQRWTDFPDALGQVRAVPVSWRLAPEWRQVFCPECRVVEDDGVRWPVRIDWLDARRLRCSDHCRLLVYQHPRLVLNHADSLETPRMRHVAELCDWLDDWVSLESYCAAALPPEECLWRRDLLVLVMRNWGVQTDYGPSIFESCDTSWAPWYESARPIRFPPGRPTRIGLMPPGQRVSALWGAYLTWCALEGQGSPIEIPDAGWHWMMGRWENRAPHHRIDQMVRARSALPSGRRRKQKFVGTTFSCTRLRTNTIASGSLFDRSVALNLLSTRYGRRNLGGFPKN